MPKSFLTIFQEQCFRDLQKLSAETFNDGVSWSMINLFFSRKLRFSKQMTRMLIKHLSKRYPISYNKFYVKVDNNGGSEKNE